MNPDKATEQDIRQIFRVRCGPFHGGSGKEFHLLKDIQQSRFEQMFFGTEISVKPLLVDPRRIGNIIHSGTVQSFAGLD